MADHHLLGASIEPTLPLSDQLTHLNPESILPMIPEIMVTLLSNLAAGVHSRPDCCRVVSHLARCAMDAIPHAEGSLEPIVSPLIKPLLSPKADSPSSLSEGSAWCLIPLVESEVWKHAPDVLVDQVFGKVAGAVEDRDSRTIGHIKLASALIRANGFMAEAYSRLFFNAALDVFRQVGSPEERYSAKEMVNSLIESGLVDDHRELVRVQEEGEEEEEFGKVDEGEERESHTFEKDYFSSQNSCYGGSDQNCDCLLSGEENGGRDESLNKSHQKNESVKMVSDGPSSSSLPKKRFLCLQLLVLAVSILVAFLLLTADYQRKREFEELPAT